LHGRIFQKTVIFRFVSFSIPALWWRGSSGGEVASLMLVEVGIDSATGDGCRNGLILLTTDSV
jgi:hypothetical protein